MVQQLPEIGAAHHVVTQPRNQILHDQKMQKSVDAWFFGSGDQGRTSVRGLVAIVADSTSNGFDPVPDIGLRPLAVVGGRLAVIELMAGVVALAVGEGLLARHIPCE